MAIQRFFWQIVLLLLIVSALAYTSIVYAQAPEIGEITGLVVDDNNQPVIGANVTAFIGYGGGGNMRIVTTDSAGKFLLTFDRERYVNIVVTYDKSDTSGIDYMPELWTTQVSPGSISSRTFHLRKGASVYFDGEIRSIQNNRPSQSYAFRIIEKTPVEQYGGSGPIMYYDWTGYGGGEELRVIGIDPRLVIIPADSEVVINVTADFLERGSYSSSGASSFTFTVKGDMGYLKLSQGDVLHFDIRKSNIISNAEVVRMLLGSSFTLLENCWDAGFLVEAERQDLLSSFNSIEESLLLLNKKAYDEAFSKLRTAFILTDRSKTTLEGLIRTSSQSSLMILFFLVFVAAASSYLITERRSSLEILAGKRTLTFSANIFIGSGIYALLVILFYILFPGCRLVPQLVFIPTIFIALLVGQAIVTFLPGLFPERASEDRSIQFRSALVAAFSMGCRNLRRRRLRTIISLINIMVLVFGFITFTSLSPGYGLLAKPLQPTYSVDALLIRDEPAGGNPRFIALPDSFITWLRSQANVTAIARKTENTPASAVAPLGHFSSLSSEESMMVLGVIGIEPSIEANLTHINNMINKGDYIKDGDLQGILVSSSWQSSLKVDVGDKVYGFGKEFTIRGFFDPAALNTLLDIDGRLYVPYHIEPMVPDPMPCPADEVVIVAYEASLSLPRVVTSRVAVQLKNTENYDVFARVVAVTYEYKVYVSHPGSLYRQELGGYIEEKGTTLVPFLMLLVMLNIAVSMLGSVRERRDEIASLSAVGLNPTHITALFIAEATVIGLIGGGFGYLMGISGYQLASNTLFGALQVREKVSAEWGLVAIMLSVGTAIFASLIPSLQASTLITPSLLRKWRMKESERPKELDQPWLVDLPVKLMPREVEPFAGFIVNKLKERLESNIADIKLEEETTEKGLIKRIGFEFSIPEESDRSINEIIIQKGRSDQFDLNLLCTPAGSRTHVEETVHRTATYVRKLLFEWNAMTFEVATPYDPSMSQLYTLVNAYSPTTLYIVTSQPDVSEKLEAFRKALVLRAIRPPRFVISKVDPHDITQTMKATEEVTSRADVICISGRPESLCSALAIHATRLKKITCYVVDNRTPEERAKDPYQDLKVVNVS